MSRDSPGCGEHTGQEVDLLDVVREVDPKQMAWRLTAPPDNRLDDTPTTDQYVLMPFILNIKGLETDLSPA